MSLKKTNNRGLWLFVFLIIYVSDDSLLFGTNQNEIFVFSKYIIYTIINAYLLVVFRNKGLLKRGFSMVIFVFLLCLTILLSSLFNSDLRNGSFLFIYTLITAVIFVSKYSLEEFGTVYIKLLYYFSIFSLTTYIINIFFPAIFSVFPSILNYGGVQFKFLLFGNIFDGFNLTRNLSVFREPGVYGFHLCISLILQLLRDDLFISRKILIVTLLALLSTLSTTGILVFGLIILTYNLKNRKIKSTVYSVFLLTGLLIIVIINPELLNSIFAKFDSNSIDYASSFSRTASFYVPLEIIHGNWFFGVGLTSFVDMYSLESLKLFGVMLSADSAATNTLLNLFSVYGIWTFLLILYAIYSFSSAVDRKFSVLIFIILIMLLSSQELRYSLLFSVIVAFGISNTKKYQLR